MLSPCSVSFIVIRLISGKDLTIFAERQEENTLLERDPQDALNWGEEPCQLQEGATYEYVLPDDYEIKVTSDIVRPSRDKKNRGRLIPNIYVGRLKLTILKDNSELQTVALEVRSVKTGYRSDYQDMLDDITKYCSDLVMLHSSPVTQRFTPNHEASPTTLYQRFAFVKSVVDADDFREAVQQILAMPATLWKPHVQERDIRRAGRITSSTLRQIASRANRMNLPSDHPLHSQMRSVPTHISEVSKVDTVDTPENRFVKHALREFQCFCTEVRENIEKAYTIDYPHIHSDAKALEERLGQYLDHALFREISEPTTLPLNSPILQRKAGYREVLRVWHIFNIAARLAWKALTDDEYHAGKRDVATLYEYWVFFKLLEVVNTVFDDNVSDTKHLISATDDGMGVQLSQGKSKIALEGKSYKYGRDLQFRFDYNRTFGKTSYPSAGSWTQQMRPDYTLSLWPAAFKESQAESQELMVHIHFDAKYKVEGLKYLIGDNGSPSKPKADDSLSDDESAERLDAMNQEKREQTEGTYKRADLLKMHAYKDAIRRTAGAYVLYPGPTEYTARGFHEIVPGLGAFPMSPSKLDTEKGVLALKDFIIDVVQNVTNRFSQREELSYYTFDINAQERPDRKASETFPESYNGKRVAPVNNTTVLVGYSRTEQYNWIRKEGRYNIRIDKESGLEKYGLAEAGARYLLLHGKGRTAELWQIVGASPEVWSKDDLIALDYPRPSRESYLVFEISKKGLDKKFYGMVWDVEKLTTRADKKRPFACTLSEMMQARV